MMTLKKKPYLKDCIWCGSRISMRFVGRWVAFDKDSSQSHRCYRRKFEPDPLPRRVIRCRDCASPVMPGWNVCYQHR
ncbi:MAG TPA: hypothetical protein VIU29_04170 [Candidatus Deferrimicrobiaceae bacterium]